MSQLERGVHLGLMEAGGKYRDRRLEMLTSVPRTTPVQGSKGAGNNDYLQRLAASIRILI